MEITVSPSNLSAELRAALDLPLGAPPPWQARLLAFGLPIDYRDIEVEAPEPEKVRFYVDVAAHSTSTSPQRPSVPRWCKLCQ